MLRLSRCSSPPLYKSTFPYFAHHITQKVYRQALCYMLIFMLPGKEYDIRIEQNAGHGPSDILVHPLSPQHSHAFVFEIKSVSPNLKRNGNRSPKTANQIGKDLERAKVSALVQIENCHYRERVPHHATTVHEFAFVFCGKFCVAAVRTLQRNVAGVWVPVAVNSTAVSESAVNDADMSEGDVGDEDEGA